MEFDLFHGYYDNKHTGVVLVEISDVFGRESDFDHGAVPFDRVHQHILLL